MAHGVADEGRDWLCWWSPGCRCWLRYQPGFPEPLLPLQLLAGGKILLQGEGWESTSSPGFPVPPMGCPSEKPPRAFRLSALLTFLWKGPAHSPFVQSTSTDIYRHPVNAEAIPGSISHKTHWQIAKAGMNLYSEDHLQVQVLSLWICAWYESWGFKSTLKKLYLNEYHKIFLVKC